MRIVVKKEKLKEYNKVKVEFSLEDLPIVRELKNSEIRRFGGERFGGEWSGNHFSGLYYLHVPKKPDQGKKIFNIIEIKKSVLYTKQRPDRESKYPPDSSKTPWVDILVASVQYTWHFKPVQEEVEPEWYMYRTDKWYKTTLRGVGRNRDYSEHLEPIDEDKEVEILEIMSTSNSAHSGRFGHSTKIYIANRPCRVVGEGVK